MEFAGNIIDDIAASGGWLLWLIHQPSWLIGFVIVAGGALFSVLCVLLVNNYFTAARLVENNAVASFKFVFMAQVFAGLLAFLMVEAGTRYNNAETYVSNEAAAWQALSRLTEEMPKQEGDIFRAKLRHYLDAVIRTEWKAMETGGESPVATAAFEEALNAYFAIDPETDRQQSLLSLGNQLTAMAVEARTSRLNNNVSHDIHNLTWFTMFVLVTITVAFNSFFGTNFLRSQLMMGTILAIGLFSNVFLTFLLANPFAGENAVEPRPFEEILK
jgi:hypothetical protein